VSVGVALRSEGAALLSRTSAPWRVGALVLLGGLMLALQLRLREEADLWSQVAGQLVAFAIFVPAALLCWRGLCAGRLGLLVVLVLAAAFRAACVMPGETPVLSDDLHRYAWDARVQAAGISPYRYAPVDPALAALRDDEVWPDINLPAWHTVYPPGAEASFVVARGLFGDRLGATTLLFLLAEAAAIALIVLVLARMPSRPPLERVALFAWHPLAIAEIAANGHVDALGVLGLAGLVAAWQGRRFALAGLAVGFAALAKLGPLLLLPALARRGGVRFVAPALALVVLAYAAYAVPVGTAVFGDLLDYIERQRFGSGLWWALRQELGQEWATGLCGLVVLAVLGVVALRAHESIGQVSRSCLLVLGTLLLCVSYVQPWHALWLLPFFALVRAPAWIWLTGTLPLLYVYGIDRELPDWVRVVVYGGFATVAVGSLLLRRQTEVELSPLAGSRVAAVIPALNEGRSLPAVLDEIPAGAVDEVVVVDGGSTDRTAERAAAAGARVVVERRRGYGRACAAGAAATNANVIVFLDGDGSDDPAAIPALVAPILERRAALVLGARRRPEPGALHLHQRVGNRLVALLVRLVYGCPVHDIPPMRAIRRDTLDSVELREMTYGWPTEMLVRAARAGLPILEIDVPSRPRRAGESKIAGRAIPSVKAGATMLAVVARYA
jgi:Glycosyl transferase family 2/Glycosyltransferase family 87